ncbi:MAG TPA: ABC transporter substrate-binding protein [Candidatus Caenarcaniphilales bacterium]|nr:ABC transporter substrate-binding protein [Candidatus Caenarcaniphilales bacterium]
MKRRFRVLSLALLSLVLAVAIGACGGGEGGGQQGGGSGTKGASGQVKQGGEMVYTLTSFPDFLDPALSYTVEGWETLWLVYTPLLTYPHESGAAGAKLIPGLAESLPKISPDGTTYDLKLRSGMKYSDGSPVKASDFEHTIKRILKLESGGSAFYTGIKGAEEYVKGKDNDADITGIETNDETGDITITLNEPDGTFSNVLAMDFAGVVPGDTPFENMTKNPPPGTGPYKLANVTVGRQHQLERNPEFSIPGVPRGNLDQITIKVNKSTSRQAQDVITGQTDGMDDPPPPDLLPQIRQQQKDRYREEVTVSTYYFFLNQRIKPFDNPKAREAVNVGVDKPALARLFGGLLAPGCNFLPPGMPGYQRIEPCPWGNPNQPPDLNRARQLLQESGEAGTEVTVYGNDEPETKRVTEAFADMLDQIGFKTQVKILDGSVYFQAIGDQKTKAQAGFANWFQDFPHPANFMFLVNGKSIQPTNNQNFGNVDDPEITQGIEDLKQEADISKAAPQWASLDRKLVERAHVVPYGHRKLTVFLGPKMNFAECSLFHPVYNKDFSSFCLK